MQDILHPDWWFRRSTSSYSVPGNQEQETEDIQAVESAAVVGGLQQEVSGSRRQSWAKIRNYLLKNTAYWWNCFRVNKGLWYLIFYDSQIVLLVDGQTAQNSSEPETNEDWMECQTTGLTLGFSALLVLLLWMILPHIALCAVILLVWKMHQQIHREELLKMSSK